MEEHWSGHDSEHNHRNSPCLFCEGMGMSHSSAIDLPHDLGDFTPMLLESMDQVFTLAVLKLS